jgi:hypothetical protein
MVTLGPSNRRMRQAADAEYPPLPVVVGNRSPTDREQARFVSQATCRRTRSSSPPSRRHVTSVVGAPAAPSASTAVGDQDVSFTRRDAEEGASTGRCLRFKPAVRVITLRVSWFWVEQRVGSDRSRGISVALTPPIISVHGWLASTPWRSATDPDSGRVVWFVRPALGPGPRSQIRCYVHSLRPHL